MTLLAVLFCLTGARAQQALPYEYGFEDNDLSTDGWVLQGATSNYTGITTNAKQTGNYGFRFAYSEENAYLLSPILSGGDTGLEISFYYKEADNSWGDEQFQVGYTTDESVTDASEFTYGDVVTASLTWQEYTTILPAGTKRIAIKYIFNDSYYLYLDDFSFAAGVAPTCAQPTGVTVSDITIESAVVSWTSDADAWNVRYRISGTDDWTIESCDKGTDYPIDNLSANTTYEVQVQTDCGGGDTSDWSNAVSFTTDCENPIVVNYTLNDSYGDGWNGNAIRVFDENNEVIGSLTITSGSSLTGTLKICGNYAKFEWVKGSYPGETSWVFTDANGDELFSGTGNSSMATGDVLYEIDNSSCVKPTGLALVGEPTYNSAQLTWTPGDEGQDTWQICINDDETNLISVGPTPSYTFECTEATTYNIKVRAFCSADDQSVWSDVLSFTTPEQFPTPTELDFTGVTNSTIDLKWTENGTATAWVVAYKAEDDADFTEVETTENPFTLTGLADGTLYNIKVRAKYADAQSAWSSDISVRTDFCSAEQKCFITYEIKAKAYQGSYQYGWLNSFLVVSDTETEEIIDAWTVPTGDADGIFNGELAVCPGRDITFWWYTYNSNNDAILIGDIIVKDFNGEDIINTTGALTEDVSYVVDCTLSEFKKPTNLAVSQIGPDSAVLSWTENGEATAWVIELTDNNAQETTYVDASENPFTLTGLTAETEYFVRVRPAGENEKWSEGISFTTTVDCPVPTDVAVTPQPTSAEVTWTGFGESYNVRYRKGVFVFSDDFESGIGQWTVVRNGNGTANTDWRQFDPSNFTSSSFTAHSGDYVAMSRSYAGSAYSVDNWLISPEIDLGGAMIYWAMGDSEYPENYYVYVSTTTPDPNNFDPDAFTRVYAPEEVTDEWTQHTVDLSAYAGQTGYVAFRNIDEDKDFLFIDDVIITGPATEPEEWTTTSTTETSIELTGLDPETKYEVQVQAVKGNETSEWTASTVFTTLSGAENPIDLAADEITATTATLSWTGYQDSYNVQYRTAEVINNNYFTNFNSDDDRDGWSWEGYTIYGFNDPIYGYSGDDNYFLQMGWDTTDEATIVSPELPEYESGSFVEFYYFGYNIANTFQVGYSSTDNDLDSFEWSDPINAPLAEYTLFNEVLPDGIKYVAFKATASSQDACIFIDDFRIYNVVTPAGEWETATVEEPTLALTDLVPNTEYEWQVQGVYEGGTTEWVSSNFTTEELIEIELVNDDSENDSEKKNSVFIADAEGQYCDVLLSDRTLYKDDNWNTICLPFSLTADELAASPLAGAEIRTLADASVTGWHVDMEFTQVDEIQAGVPYIIKWESGDPIENPVFSEVKLSSEMAPFVSSDGNVTFSGYYDAFEVSPDDDPLIYYFSDGSELKYAGNPRTLYACRAYFTFTANEAAGNNGKAFNFTINYGDGSVPTTISNVEMEKNGAWYTVDGRKLLNKPTAKGVYINNGKKTVIK